MKMTQEDISNIIGMSKKQYARLERGELDEGKLIAIRKLADYYGVTTDFILDNSNEIESEIASVIKQFPIGQQEFILETLVKIKEMMESE